MPTFWGQAPHPKGGRLPPPKTSSIAEAVSPRRLGFTWEHVFSIVVTSAWPRSYWTSVGRTPWERRRLAQVCLRL
jgi:hypothetical protein